MDWWVAPRLVGWYFEVLGVWFVGYLVMVILRFGVISGVWVWWLVSLAWMVHFVWWIAFGFWLEWWF